MMRSWTRRNGSNPLGSLSLHPRCGKIRADVNRQIIQDSPYGRGRSAFEILVWFRLGRLRYVGPAVHEPRRIFTLPAQYCQLNGPNRVSLSPLSGAGVTQKRLRARTMTGGDPRLGQTLGKPATLYLPQVATTRNVTAFLPRRGGGLTPLACFSACGRRCRYGNGSGLGCDGARQSPLQSLLLGVVEGGAQHRAADTLKTRQHLVGGHFADQQEQRRVARLQALRNILHELVVDAVIRQGAAERAGGCADRRAGERHQKDQTDQGAPKRSRYRTGRRRMEQLVELDTAVRLLDGDDSVAEFDQVVLSICREACCGFLPPSLRS